MVERLVQDDVVSVRKCQGKSSAREYGRQVLGGKKGEAVPSCSWEKKEKNQNQAVNLARWKAGAVRKSVTSPSGRKEGEKERCTCLTSGGRDCLRKINKNKGRYVFTDLGSSLILPCVP